MDFTRSFGALRARDLIFRFKTQRDMIRESADADPRFTNENAVQAETGESAA